MWFLSSTSYTLSLVMKTRLEDFSSVMMVRRVVVEIQPLTLREDVLVYQKQYGYGHHKSC